MDQAPALPPRDWIVAHTESSLSVIEMGSFATPEGQIMMLDPLAFHFRDGMPFVSVPTGGGALVAFRDIAEGRNSKLALIFADAPVAGGANVASLAVDAGMASVFSPTTVQATIRFFDSLPAGQDPYNNFFSHHDDPDGGEAKIVPLPDGTPVPYVHSGWGDGVYPVFTLADNEGNVIAIYTDFMGRNTDGDDLLPPGVTPATD